MNWQTALQKKILDGSVEEDLNTYLRKVIPPFKAPVRPFPWLFGDWGLRPCLAPHLQ